MKLEFLDFAEQLAHRQMERIRQVFIKAFFHIDTLCHDWTSWGEAYEMATARSVTH